MRREILRIFAEHNTVLSPDAWEYLSRCENARTKVEEIVCSCDTLPFPIDVEWLESFNTVREGRPATNGSHHGELPTEDEITVLHDITGNSTCTGELNDFVSYFTHRFRSLKAILSKRREASGCMDIARVKKRGGKAKVIAMVGDIGENRGGYKILNMEDESGKIRGLMNPESPAYGKSILEDEVLIVTGEVARKKSGYEASFFIDDVVRPGIPKLRENGNGKAVKGKIAFTGDIHVGSTSFMRENWDRFVSWINSDDELAMDIRYLVIPGDIIDGIGIYPNQREDLEIHDIYEQYRAAASMLAQIPPRITIICIPGNHDMVRNPEPQPSLPPEIQAMFPSNTRFYGNPSFLNICGLKILIYHGSSITDLSDMLTHVEAKKPTTAMIEMLEMRHLVPVYGKNTPIAPEKQDHLVIGEIPDIFVTGHIHRTEVNEYNGVILINSSTWQDQTEYQKMRDIKPDPGKIVILDSGSQKAYVKSFA